MGEQPATAAAAIEIRIEEIDQLFQSFDPFPLREKDLDKDVEEFIVGWARELPTDQPLRIIVQLGETQVSTLTGLISRTSHGQDRNIPEPHLPR